MAVRFATPVEQVFDSNGDPLAGAKLYFYDTGTATPHNTYSDDALATPNANPVVADSAGRFGAIFLDNAEYKVILKTSADVTIWTADPVHGGPANPLFSAISVKSGNYTVVSGDNGKLIPVTATATITLPAATVGSTFRIGIVNAGAGIVTVARAGADTIGTGLTSLKLAPNQGAVFQSDGTSKFYVVGFDGRGKGADVASAATLAIGEDGDYFHVTGTTTITAIEARPTGFQITLEFDAALTLTHNPTSLILPGAANIVTAAGDVAKFVSESDGGNWRCASYMRASVAPGFTIDKTGATLTIVNDAAEQTLYSATVPAGAMGLNGAVRMSIHARYLNNTVATRTYTLRIKFGGVTLFADASEAITQSASPRVFRLDIIIANANAANVQNLFATHFLSTITAATTGIGDLGVNGSVDPIGSASGASTADTTTAQTLTVTFQHSLADANLSISRVYATAELV